MSYVLIVDDDVNARILISRVVKSLGMKAVAVANGEEALRRSQEETPALVMLDLLMPGMDGFTVYWHLRNLPQTRHTPVIVATACSMDQVDMLRLPGVSTVVPKGDLRDLRHIIGQTLGITPA